MTTFPSFGFYLWSLSLWMGFFFSTTTTREGTMVMGWTTMATTTRRRTTSSTSTTAFTNIRRNSMTVHYRSFYPYRPSTQGIRFMSSSSSSFTTTPTTTTTTCLYSSTSSNNDETNESSTVASTMAVTGSPNQTRTGQDDDDDDDDEWELVEYDDLTEQDFVMSEWLVGTNWNNKPSHIQETWVRCLSESSDTTGGRLGLGGGGTSSAQAQPCVWGDGSKGRWYFDQASQYFSISKEYLWGKTIWAGVVEDYYFLQGTVRGWTYVTPAEVLGQWQAKRLGVDPEEAGIPPWFEQDDDEQEEEEEEAEENEESESEIESSNVVVNQEEKDKKAPTETTATAVVDDEEQQVSKV